MTRTHPKRTATGFSLLEVLIAVVLLATGLLALAALQGSLARNSADAKTRSRVVALLSAEMDNLRAQPYTDIVTAATVTANPTAADCAAPANDVVRAACDAALGSLSLTRTVTRFGANAAGNVFVEGAAPAGSSTAEFKQIVVSASWTDTTNQPRALAMRTAVSELALDPNSPLVDDPAANHTPQGAIVRQASPLTAGMIPIALGNGDSTAASNPMPEEVGRKGNVKVGTRFNVLTYTPEQSGLAVIQQRIETEVLKCKCQYGEGGGKLPEIYRASQWPAVWTGTRYDVHVPDTATAAPGQQYASGQQPNAVQSDLCQECCRDHHDNTADTTNARFDPEATGGYQKYDINGGGNLVAANPTPGQSYVDSCRVIRVDGMWRVAADMYLRQYGLLETQANGSVQAGTGIPTPLATNYYTSFVKDYLKQYDGSTGAAPSNAQGMYDNDSQYHLNDPATVTINLATDKTPRFVHSRGLYVDHLEKLARDKLAKSLATRQAKGECDSATLADCVLPFLPFTTINLTELADYESANTNVITVHTGGYLPWDDTPSRGYTVAQGTGTANNRSRIRKSNSGLAATEDLANGGVPGPTDKNGDEAEGTDAQSFTVGGTSSGSGDKYYVVLSGVTSTNPGVVTVINGAAATCQFSTLWTCTPATTLPGSGKLTLSNYFKEYDATNGPYATVNVPKGMCTETWDNGVKSSDYPYSDRSFSVRVPMFQNFQLVGANVSPGSGTVSIGALSDNGTRREKVELDVSSISNNAQVNLTFSKEGADRTDATPKTCTVFFDKKTDLWTLNVSAWNYPWL